MEVVFEFEKVPGGIFEKKCVVLEARAGEADSGLLVEAQTVRLSLLQQPLPRIFREEYQAKMTGIYALL